MSVGLTSSLRLNSASPWAKWHPFPFAQCLCWEKCLHGAVLYKLFSCCPRCCCWLCMTGTGTNWVRADLDCGCPLRDPPAKFSIGCELVYRHARLEFTAGSALLKQRFASAGRTGE